jgi:hypothetical protein
MNPPTSPTPTPMRRCPICGYNIPIVDGKFVAHSPRFGLPACLSSDVDPSLYVFGPFVSAAQEPFELSDEGSTRIMRILDPNDPLGKPSCSVVVTPAETPGEVGR